MEPLCCTRQEAAEIIGCAVATVDILIKRRIFHAVHVGVYVRIPLREVHHFIAMGGLVQVWPKKRDGKTTRQVAPVMKKKLATCELRNAEPKRERA